MKVGLSGLSLDEAPTPAPPEAVPETAPAVAPEAEAAQPAPVKKKRSRKKADDSSTEAPKK
jgi:hypothetical protein